MTAIIKQNVSFAQLQEWSLSNPNRSHVLPAIEGSSEASLLRSRDLTAIDSSLDTIRLGEFESITLNPSGMLSAIAFMSDSVYAYSPVRSRQMMLRELATQLQIDTDKLTGTALGRKRRKLHDGIGTLANASAIKPEEWLDLFSGLAIMRNLQLIFVQMSTVEHDHAGDETEPVKALYFSSDPVKWTSDKKIWVVDYYGRWVASPRTDSAVGSLYEWLDEIEIYGWTVHWHIDTTKTKEDLIGILSSGVTWEKEHAKLKKDTLAIRLAKQSTVSTLYRISHSA